jgi:hypothetical protein
MHRASCCVAGLALAFLALAPAVPAAAAESSNGLIVAVNGQVAVERGGGSEQAVEGYVLREGDTVIVRPGARCSGFTPLGESFDLVGPAELKVAAAEGVAGGVASWIKLQLAEWIGESRRQPLTTRTVRDWAVTTEAPTPLIPAPEGRVRSSRAHLVWSEVPGIDSYVLTVAPATGDEETRIVRDQSAVLTDLTPGEEYVWKVRPDSPDWVGESNWRSFTVMTPDEEAELDRAVTSLADLEAGVLLLSSGLHEEAVYRFDVAASAPGQSRSARLWRARALADMGLYKQAYDDLIEARGGE